MANDTSAYIGLAPNGRFAQSPELVTLIGGLSQRLGGTFHISPEGKRKIGVPLAAAFDDEDGKWDLLPHPVPEAELTERFLSAQQYEGAMRLVTTLLNRLHPTDADFLIETYGHVMKATKVAQKGGSGDAE